MNKTLEKILEDELFENETFEGEGNLSIKHTSAGTKMPTTLIGNTIQDGEPSPENPVKLRHLADDINIFDEEWDTTSSSSTSKNFIPVFAGEKYIISLNGSGTAVNYWFYEDKDGEHSTTYISAGKAFQPEKNGFIKINRYPVTEDMKFKIQKGSVITPYSIYGKGTVNINNHNKNYLNVPKFFTFTQAKEIPVSIPAGKYKVTFSSESHSGNDYPVIKFSDNNKAEALVKKELIFSINNNETKIVFYSNGYNWPGSAGIEATINELMISKDDGQYEQYQGEDIVIQTKPLRSLPNEVRDEKDGSKTIRNIKELALDSTGDWALGTTGNNIENQRFYLRVEDVKDNCRLRCSHFLEIYPGISTNGIFKFDEQGCNISNGKILQIKINKSIASTVEEFKAFLEREKEKGTPVTIYYELAEPIIEEDTENKLANLTSHNGETNIACTSEISCGLKVDAKISKIKKLEEQINAQGGV